ncbi:Hexaprenyl-diphosphate synthase large subunit ((2E,6E)-farnesyl-diphosphate specific) [archaeon HR01]|nr:Hexaprenyl-diphosphate synthase large subunit ((2E,6E)-farnesyl-diphosphate specific) [archaeon HR01]
MGLVEHADLEAVIEALRIDIDRNLQAKIRSRADRLLLEKALKGGKRLRPILLLLVFKALNGKDYQKALDVAAALEIAHSASLVHDDIIDIDTKRRGGLSLWRQLGVGKALLQGHRMINFAFDTVLEKGIDIARIFVDAWDMASKGILDEFVSQFKPSIGRYMLLIREKTASLFEAAAHAGALPSETDHETMEKMKRYGLEIGIAYQLADDLGEIIHFKQHGRIAYLLGDVRQRFLRALISSKTGHFNWLIFSISPKTPSEGFLMKEIVSRVVMARSIIRDTKIPNTSYKALLEGLPMYYVKQILRESIK